MYTPFLSSDYYQPAFRGKPVIDVIGVKRTISISKWPPIRTQYGMSYGDYKYPQNDNLTQISKGPLLKNCPCRVNVLGICTYSQCVQSTYEV